MVATFIRVLSYKIFGGLVWDTVLWALLRLFAESRPYKELCYLSHEPQPSRQFIDPSMRES